MTREEAKRILYVYRAVNLVDASHREAFDMAIKALEQERSRSAEITQYRHDCEKLMEENERLKKALEQEPCKDAISRQVVLDLIEHYNSDGLGAVFYGYEQGVKFADAVNKLPSVSPQQRTGRWIPVSERLPEVGSEVLVCFDFKGKRSVYISDFYGDGEFHGLDDEYLTPEGRKYRKAVAWMPLPEPYKVESEVQDADSN